MKCTKAFFHKVEEYPPRTELFNFVLTGLALAKKKNFFSGWDYLFDLQDTFGFFGKESLR
jgi:hypothetical protein